MNRKLCRISSSIFLRYLLSYIALLFLVLFSIGAYMSQYYEKKIHTQFLQANLNHLEGIAAVHGDNLSQMRNIAAQICLNPSIAPFKLKTDGLRALDIRAHIGAYMTNRFFRDLFLKFDIDEYVYNSSTSVHMDLLLEKGLLFGNISPSRLREDLTLARSWKVYPSQPVKGFLQTSLQEGVLFIFPVELTLQGIRYGTLMVLVDARAYDALFDSNFSWPLNQYIAHDGEVVIQRADFPLPWDLLSAAAEGAGTYHTAKYEGEEITILKVRDKDNQMEYLLAVPARAYLNALRMETRPFWLFVACLSVLCFGMIVLLSRSNHRPIRKIREGFHDEPLANDFAAIESGIRRLEEKNTNLSMKLVETQEMRRTEFVRKFVRNQGKGRGTILQEAESVGLRLDRPFYAISLIGVSGNDNLPDIKGPVKELMSPDMDGAVAELFMHERVLAVVFADSHESILTWAGKLRDFLLRQGEFPSTVAISQIHDRFEEASVAYIEAATAYDNRFVKGNQSLLIFDSAANSSSGHTPVYPVKHIHALQNALRLCDGQALDKAVEDLHTFFRITPLSLFEFRCVYNDIMNTAAKECFERGISLDNDFFDLSGCLSLEDLNAMLHSTCMQMLRRRTTASEGEADPLIARIAGYLREHYHDADLSLSGIAERFEITPKRLSLDFKQATGMSPSDYLIMLRIDRAKELLRRTDLPVKDICLLVGYCDYSGFNNRFKKYTFMTPLQYRNLPREGCV